VSALRGNIKREMELRRWKAPRLSAESGVPQPTISRYLSGKHRALHDENVAKLARGFGISEAQLRGFTEPSEPLLPVAREEPPLSPRQQAMLSLFDALPKSEQEAVMSDLAAKKRHFDQLWEEMSEQRKVKRKA